MLPRRLTLPPHPPAKLTPAPSYSCKLFCAPKKVNPYQISNFQTLFAKYPRWGHLRIHSISLAPPITCATQCAIPSALSQLRILPVAAGVYPHTPSPSASLFQRPASSVEFSRACRLFALSLPCFSSSRRLFSIVCSLFSQTPGVGCPASLTYFASSASFTSPSAMLKFLRHRYDHP